jgi:hypothetical protein
MPYIGYLPLCTKYLCHSKTHCFSLSEILFSDSGIYASHKNNLPSRNISVNWQYFPGVETQVQISRAVSNTFLTCYPWLCFTLLITLTFPPCFLENGISSWATFWCLWVAWGFSLYSHWWVSEFRTGTLLHSALVLCNRECVSKTTNSNSSRFARFYRVYY